MTRANKTFVVAAALLAALGTGLATATLAQSSAKLEFPDYDDELMKDLERTIKYFEPDIVAGNDAGVADDLAVLRQGFRYTETYFTHRLAKPDAVKISRDGLGELEAAQKSFAEKNLDEAAAHARAVADACKTCHDAYKPKQARG